jgi:hypothetical protein
VSAPHTVVLVEGRSDEVALRTAARRAGRQLADEGIEVVAMGGVTNIRTYAARYGPPGSGLRLTGLYDAAEESWVRNGLAAAGVAPAHGADGLRSVGFHRCDRDLEDELIRALGPDGAEAVIEAAGELRSLQLLARMPAQRGWTRVEVLRRFLGSQAGRKARYAQLFVEAVEPGRVPTPIAALLDNL